MNSAETRIPEAILGQLREWVSLSARSLAAHTRRAVLLGSFALFSGAEAAPVNDDFAEATVLPGSSGQVNGSNVDATGEAGEDNHADNSLPLNSVWYQWTAEVDGVLDVDTLGSAFDTLLAVYSGDAVDALTVVATNDDNYNSYQSYLSCLVEEGTTYWIAVDGFEMEEGDIVLSYAYFPKAPNDDFAEATVLDSGGASVVELSTGATGEPDEPDHADGSQPLSSLWWSWTPLVGGSVTISTVGSFFDTTLAVYEGTELSTLSEVASNDDAGSDVMQSEVTFEVSAETTYRIAVDGYDVNAGRILLEVRFRPDPGPEIRVLRDEVSLVDDSDTVDFGPVALGFSAERRLTIRNVGTMTLSGLAVGFSGVNAGDYSATDLPASLEAGGSAELTLTLEPDAAGPQLAALQISSNDSDESPFDLALEGVAGTAVALYDAAAEEAGLTGDEADPASEPHRDGVSNLLKYAFNMNLIAADASYLQPDGEAGLPLFDFGRLKSANEWSLQYVRRKASGLSYTPMYSNSLTGFSPVSGEETVEDIDDTWERVRVTVSASGQPKGFGRVEVTFPAP